MRMSRRRKITLYAVAVVAFVAVGVTTGQAFASVHRGSGHPSGMHTWRVHHPAPSGSAHLGQQRPSAAPTTARPTTDPTHAVPTSSAPAASPTGAASPPATADSVATSVVNQINQLRAQHGLPAYTVTSGLLASAHAHNLLMINGCGLSHQCSGEASLGARISAQGVKWTAAGENIGMGGPIANTAAAITAAAQGQTTSMYNETPPNDGHRQNLLSSTFTHLGIDVIRDGNGTVWMTQDFSN